MTISALVERAQTTSTAVTELGPIGSLTYDLGRFTSFQCYDDSGVSTYVAGLDPIASSDGTYSLFSFQVDTSGVLGATPNQTQTFDSYYDNLLGLTLPVSTIQTTTQSPAVMVQHLMRMGRDSDTTLVTPTNPYLVFGNSLTAGSSGTYPAFLAPTTETGGIDMSSAVTTDLDLPYDLVQSFVSGSTLYLFLTCSTADDNGVYPYTILELTSSGGFASGTSGSGTLDTPYTSMATFTVYQQSGTGTKAEYTAVPYLFALTGGSSSGSEWYVMEIAEDSSSKTFSLGDVVYKGTLDGSYATVTALNSPVANNVFMFLSSANIAATGYPWQILQVTDGSQVGQDKTGSPSTLLEPDQIQEGNALIPYGRFTGVDVGGMSYLMGAVESASTAGTYLYTSQYPSAQGVMLPTSFTSEYLRAVVAASNTAYANANAGAEAPTVSLTGPQVKKYAEEIETYQSDFLSATQTWTEQRAKDVSELLAVYVGVQGQFSSLQEGLRTFTQDAVSFSNKHQISVSVPQGKQGKQISGKHWMNSYMSQGQANLTAFNKLSASYETTILGLVENALSALDNISSQSSKNSDVLNDFADTLDQIDKNIESVHSAIVGASGIDSKLLKKYQEKLTADQAMLKEINEELHKWLISAIALGLAGGLATTCGIAAVIVSATIANVVGLLLFVAFVIYEAVALQKQFTHLEAEQKKALNDISKDQAEINELEEEITELNNLSSISSALNTSVNGVISAAQGSVTSLNGISSDLKDITRTVVEPSTLTQDMVVQWLANKNAILYSPVTYDPNATLSEEDAQNWSGLANIGFAKLYTAAPSQLSGMLGSLIATCALAESLQANTQLSYKTELLTTLNASSGPTTSNK